MGDRRRFDIFADFIARQIKDKSARIADVAAGGGYLSFALRERGFKYITPFEPYPRRGGQVRRLGIQARLFDDGSKFDVLVGMHPDEATDVILDEAIKHRLRAIVVPCCAKPTRWVYWGAKGSVRDWCASLKRQAERRGLWLNETILKMTGANTVLFT